MTNRSRVVVDVSSVSSYCLDLRFPLFWSRDPVGPSAARNTRRHVQGLSALISVLNDVYCSPFLLADNPWQVAFL